MSQPIGDRISQVLRDVADFPKPGILFKDITPLLAQPELMRDVIDALAAPFVNAGITHVAAIESRGFLFGVPVALALQTAFVPARKPGKLPWRTARVDFQLEYGADALEMHADAIERGARVLVVDDVLATGGTLAATCALLEGMGGIVAGISTVIEISSLAGRERLSGRHVHSLLAS